MRLFNFFFQISTPHGADLHFQMRVGVIGVIFRYIDGLIGLPCSGSGRS